MGISMPDEGSFINHTTEEEMHVCRTQVEKHPGGRLRGTEQGRLGDKEHGVCWPEPKVSDSPS